MAELTPEEIRGLLEGITDEPWTAEDPGFCVRNAIGMPVALTYDGMGREQRLIAAAPDLARQLLAAMEENERLHDAIEHEADQHREVVGAKTPHCEACLCGWPCDSGTRLRAVLVARPVRQTDRIATLEGIVRRLAYLLPLGEVDADSAPSSFASYEANAWVSGWNQAAEATTNAMAEVLILKEMQQ